MSERDDIKHHLGTLSGADVADLVEVGLQLRFDNSPAVSS